MSKAKNTQFNKQEAKRLGFLNCGIAKTEFLEDVAPRLNQWLKNGFHAKMNSWKIILISNIKIKMKKN